MDSWETSVYIREVLNQCEAVEIATSNFNNSLQSNISSSVPIIFASSQSLLAAASMILKLLWPQPASFDKNGVQLSEEEELRRQRIIRRGKTLRKILIKRSDDVHLLENNRTVRNSFEHFDERLDDFVHEESQGNRQIVDRNVTPLGVIVIDGKEPKHLRRIDPQLISVSVLETNVRLLPLVNLIQEIKSRALVWQTNYESQRNTKRNR